MAPFFAPPCIWTLSSSAITWLLCGESVESDDCQFELKWTRYLTGSQCNRDVFMSVLASDNACKSVLNALEFVKIGGG